MQLASTGSSSEGRPAGRPVSRQVLADHVYEELLASLMDGRLEPGAAVSIDGTAKRIACSVLCQRPRDCNEGFVDQRGGKPSRRCCSRCASAMRWSMFWRCCTSWFISSWRRL